MANYRCLVCDSLFEPLGTDTGLVDTNIKVKKNLCTRKLETLDCGPFCSLRELPGCLRYSLSRLKTYTGPDGTYQEEALFTC